jgi:1-deoxy-D-xylulose-5-phosphate synthase
MIVSAPMDEIELRNLMFTAQQKAMGPFSIRYPRGCGIYSNWKKPFEKIEIGKGRILDEGEDMAILTIGKPGIFASRAVKKLLKEGISVAHYDLRFLKPLDEEILHAVFVKFDKIVTVEDGVVIGGFGSAVVEFMAKNNYSAKIEILGVPDLFVEQGTPDELYKECGFDMNGIYNTVKSILAK